MEFLIKNRYNIKRNLKPILLKLFNVNTYFYTENPII